MKLRSTCVLFAVLLLAACGGAAEEATVDAMPATDDAPMDPGAALDEMTEYYVTHYNMHHPDMVAELYADDAVFLGADGSVQEGKDAILATMQAAMASEPTLSLDVADRVITDEWAVSRGTWGLEMTPEGADAPMSLGGSFLSVHHNVDGEWKTQAVISNYDATPPAEAPRAEPPAEAPPDLADSPLAELATFYARHFNMGHGDVVASRYAEDAVVAFADSPMVTGRAAVAEQLNQRIAAGETPQITIHEVEAMEIGDGWVLGGGWYELSSSAVGDSQGSWMNLARPGDDGNMQIHWSVTNGHPVMQ